MTTKLDRWVADGLAATLNQLLEHDAIDGIDDIQLAERTLEAYKAYYDVEFGR